MNFASFDFLFVLGSQDLASGLGELCRDSGYKYRITTNPEQAQDALFHDFYKVVWIEMEDDAPFGLQILEWMQTRNFGCDTGIVFSKGHDRHVIRSLVLQNQNFLYRPVLQQRELAKKALNQALLDFELREQKQFCVVSKTPPPLTWVQATTASQVALQTALDYARSRHPWVIEGPAGSGKSHLIRCAYPAAQNQLVWDARALPLFAQKEHFLKHGPSEGQVWIIQDVGNLDLELQEIVAEFLKGQGWLAENGRIWPSAAVIVTTAEPLSDLLQARRLREDLYHLLKGRVIHLSPLKYRDADVAAISRHILQTLAGEKTPKRLTQDALEVLQNYEWPGEVLELQTTIAALHGQVAADWIEVRHLPHDLLEKNIYSILDEDENLWNRPYQEAKKRALHKFNKAYMKHLLDDSDQNYTVAAEKAGMDRSNFKKLLKKI